MEAKELVFYGYEDTLVALIETAVKKVITSQVASLVKGFHVTLGVRHDNNGHTVRFWEEVPTSVMEDFNAVDANTSSLSGGKRGKRLRLFIRFESRHFLSADNGGISSFMTHWSNALRKWGDEHHEGLSQLLQSYPISEVMCIKDDEGFFCVIMEVPLYKKNPLNLYDLRMARA